MGAVLAGEGVIGAFGSGCLAVPEGGVYLSEITCAWGAPPIPTGWPAWPPGRPCDADPGSSVAGERSFELPGQRQPQSPSACPLSRPADVIARVHAAGLAFDPSAGTGATLHLLAAVPGHGSSGRRAWPEVPRRPTT